MRYIASCSFGKDSLAAIHCRMQRGEPIDEAVYCHIQFDAETSAELPEHEDWIHAYAIPLLKSRYGIDTTIVQGEYTYTDCFYTIYTKSRAKNGQIWGFPYLNGPWCNSRLKVRPLDKWAKNAGEYTQIVGIAADEKQRARKQIVTGKIMPLVDYGVTEAEAFVICKTAGILSPAYNGGRSRLGCWFCHNQRIGELRRLRKEYPALWKKLLALDEDSPVLFKPGKSLKDYDNRFWSEEAQISLFDAANTNI
jgi:3'-phosphoadenosine 5'-phosphosulfate sulfotransferase (PAPS reductase)/FAD synthetase